ncbi:hypothetical protein POPTR_014G186600v4 [Populus trichocarpa]|uniref:Uncharacterized protein n=1 Tax=Populus trichocarpa TaxID=3694 RepID=A0ACC0RZY3_POPTR|nr:hypothetical protein POPTR_014G186600v4 [Populus trichocarpa]
MKNIAKCDTWCELQNPVNHRVFERKLRPRPLGRGHVCLGVTYRRPHSPRLTRVGADTGLPRAPARGWPKIESSAMDALVATPGQARLPAEFKHINKRRKRNLQGFP